ncbi:hypothetical protein D1B31_08065 [Neobacillus notoginsengisoli]|uniref:Uncharacterized protein n=2 Tax=Neobacillus notoginsengisoli TaxID=1578198 RepID=A0A417YW78_9BACI|nr:hypothetical protein D1B31_08065 [Neobacillus notoginsengisoli]
MSFFNEEDVLFEECRGHGNVAGIEEELERLRRNFRIRADILVNRRDFCRAVRSCLREDMIAGEMEEKKRRRKHCRF